MIIAQSRLNKTNVDYIPNANSHNHNLPINNWASANHLLITLEKDARQLITQFEIKNFKITNEPSFVRIDIPEEEIFEDNKAQFLKDKKLFFETLANYLNRKQEIIDLDIYIGSSLKNIINDRIWYINKFFNHVINDKENFTVLFQEKPFITIFFRIKTS
ncbi:MAG: hypothetical protein J0H68_05445 [Sphingobacteriia bacterium]|nr:hypothetical protein [Sphingobacteriia bacterium]